MHPKLGLIGGIRVVARFGLVCDGGWDETEGQGGLRGDPGQAQEAFQGHDVLRTCKWHPYMFQLILLTITSDF